MSKKKNRSRVRERQAAPMVQADSQFGSGYDGANQSMRRGQIFWPTLDTRKEIDTFSRNEIMRRVRWLYANQGGVRALIRNSATLVGWLTPQPDTGDEAWDDLAEKKFRDWANRKSSFSRCGKYHFENAQLMIQRASKKDGDVFTVLTTSADGKRPMVAFYESHQLANPEKSEKGWYDGVKTDGAGRHIAYGFRDDKGKVAIIPADAVVYFGDFDSPGHNRAISGLAHAVNHAIDITEIRADTKHNIKTAAQFGVVRETAAGEKATKAARALGGVLTEVRGSNTEGQSRRFEAREVWSAGQIAELDPGQKLTTVHDSRPSPNQMDFEDELWRDISIGWGLPPEVLLKMANLTGPGIRFVLEYASRWILEQQMALWDWAERIYWHWAAFETRTIGFPKEGSFLDVSFIPQRDLTIDRGREGRQRMDEIDRGMGTLDDFHRAVSGASGRKKIRQRIKEVKYAMEECEAAGVAYERVFPPRAGAAIAATEPDADEPDDASPEPKK